ncbi:MAG: hypothetical protein REH79_03545 [Spiroplasma sp.]|nr:hypothetical protein [Spiroplasma sp.]
MKKYLITLLTALILIPTTTNLAAKSTTINNSNITSNQNISVSKEFNNQLEKLLQKQIYEKNKEKYQLNDNDKDYWKHIAKHVNDHIDQTNDIKSKKLSSKLNANQKQLVKEKAKEITNHFHEKKFSIDEANQYLKEKHQNFKKHYDNRVEGFSKIDDKIMTEFFGQHKVDLNLNGRNTYQDAINNVIKEIKTKYSNQTIKIELINSKLKNKPLFDNSNNSEIINFIKNNITIEINIKINNENKKGYLQLKNIQLNPKTDIEWLDQVILAYFDSKNPQDLNISVTDTFTDALKKIVNEIKKRFPKIKIDLNKDERWKNSDYIISDSEHWYYYKKSEKFINNRLNDTFNNQTSLNVKILSINNNAKSFNKSLFLTNIKFNLQNMILAINKLFQGQNSKTNEQFLGLNTDNTFEDAINKLNQRINNFCPDQFIVSLENKNQLKEKLVKLYNPAAKENTFIIKVKFALNINNGNNVFAISNIYLGNVQLTKTALEIKESYDKLQKLVGNLKTAQLTLKTLTCIVSIAAAGFWAATYLTAGSFTPWAVACTVASGILGSCLGGIGLALYENDKAATYWNRVWTSVSGTFSLGNTFFNILYPIFVSATAELTILTWSLPVLFTAAGVIGTIITWISYYK